MWHEDKGDNPGTHLIERSSSITYVSVLPSWSLELIAGIAELDKRHNRCDAQT